MEDKIIASLKNSLQQLPHPSFKAMASVPVEKMTQHDAITRQETGRKIVPLFVKVLPVAAAFVLGLFVWVNQFVLVDSVVQLDVNPSMEFSMNKRGSVVNVAGLNPDGFAFLKEKDYKNQPLDRALNRLVWDLAQQGALKEKDSAILVSAEGKTLSKTQGLSQSVADQLALSSSENKVYPHIYTQSLVTDRERRSLAEAHHLSEGKLQLLQHLMAQDPSLSLPELTPLSIGQLLALAADLNLDTGLDRPKYEGLQINVDEPFPEDSKIEEKELDDAPLLSPEIVPKETFTPSLAEPEPLPDIGTPPSLVEPEPLPDIETPPTAALDPPPESPGLRPEPSTPVSPEPVITPRPEADTVASATASATASVTASVTASATD